MINKQIVRLGVLLASLSFSVALAQNTCAAIPTEERDALIALYSATDGAHWKNHTGWLGPAGTECEWYGIVCKPDGKMMSVFSIDLQQNNLVGEVPLQLEQLRNLEWLHIWGNRISGRLSDQVIQRSLSGPLWIAAEPKLLTDITEIEYEWTATSLLCGYHRIVLRSDDAATMFTTRCRNLSSQDRTTFCEIKKGRLVGSEFARLALFIEMNGFFGLHPEYSRSVTDSVDQKIRVTRDGKTVAVDDYAGAGPLGLWTIQRSIEGVAAQVEWQETGKTVPPERCH